MDTGDADDNCLRVIKRMAPHQPGAVKLARRYGKDLVCVRYRSDPDGLHRWTTVELIVEKVPIVKRPVPTVALRLRHDERELRAELLRQGGAWDGGARLWRAPLNAVQALGLLGRIVEK